MKTIALMMCLSMLTGCETLAGLTTTASVGSYVAPEVSGIESAIVARDMAQFLANQFPYAKTTIRLDPLKTEFHKALTGELAKRGFGIVEGRQAPGAVQVYYAVSLIDGGIVARMRFQGKEASRFYAITDKGLAFGGRYALRGAIK